MNKTAMAIVAHPDDIELMMAGTLILLGRAGYKLHYMNMANGSCGTSVMDREEIIKIRMHEARAAAATINATFHPPLVNDLEIFYTQPLISQTCSIIRDVRPEILLLQSPQDYMEDHMNASRIGVTAAFCRGLRNYVVDPIRPSIDDPVAVYHALPWGLHDQLCNPVLPHFCIDVSSVIEEKKRMLACHASQRQWLDESQGLDNYITTMVENAAAVAKLCGGCQYAEGWRRHLPAGFCAEDFNPLHDALAEFVVASASCR